MHSAMLRAAILFSGTACWALKPASRRQLLHAAPAVATGLIAAPALAEDFQASLKPLYKAAKTAKLTYRSKAGEPPPEAWAEDAFVGRYTDPINHPGGIRDIIQLVTGRKWVGTAFGGFKTRTDVPKLVDQHLAGELPIDHFITHTLQGVDKTMEAIHILESGKCLRCVVLY